MLTELTTYDVNLYINGIFDQQISITTLALPSALSNVYTEVLTTDLAVDAKLYVATTGTAPENYIYAIHSQTGYVSFFCSCLIYIWTECILLVLFVAA